MNKRQRFLLFLLVFAGTAGILKVDDSYGDMMDREPQLSLCLRRADENTILVSALGLSGEIDIREVDEQWGSLQAKVTDTLDMAVGGIRGLFGAQEEKPQEEEPLRTVDFPVQTL